jgi:hypothetical protein
MSKPHIINVRSNVNCLSRFPLLHFTHIKQSTIDYEYTKTIYVFQYEFSIYLVITKLLSFFDRDFTINITGLGILDWLVSSIMTWVVNLFDETIVGMIEGRLRAYIDEMLPNLGLP